MADKQQLYWNWIGIFLALLGIALFTPQVSAEEESIYIYFFWGDGCPHCAEEEPFLEELSERYPEVEVLSFEVWGDSANQELFREMSQAHGFEPQYVPTTFIGDRYWVGFSDSIAEEIEAVVADCAADTCPDSGAGIVPGHEPAPPTDPDEVCTAADPCPEPEEPRTITVPLLGKINLNAQSLWVSTAIISFVDGFNPCSLWVLSILIALTLHSGSRKKILTIGLIYITVTAGVYVLFIAGLFTMLTVVSFLGWIQVAVSLLALFFALVNIKDYFWYKEGFSLTIADEKKPGIYQRIRRIRGVINAGDSFWSLAAATVALGAGVSLVEFSCTAGFPVLWTNLVAAQQVTPVTFTLLLLLYMVIYQLDELAIFLVAVFTLQASRLEEKHGRILKLIGGMLMLTLAVVMLINPAWMSDLTTSLLIFGIAFVAALLVLLLHRVLLPHLGIYIGSEMATDAPKGKRRS